MSSAHPWNPPETPPLECGTPPSRRTSQVSTRTQALQNALELLLGAAQQVFAAVLAILPTWSPGEFRTSDLDPADTQPLSRNRSGRPLTRFGPRYILRKHAGTAAASVPTLAARRVHPHVRRHAAASHFLQVGVDLITIKRWLGHARVSTTSIYAAVDLESNRKAKPLLSLDTGSSDWRTDADTLSWLERL